MQRLPLVKHENQQQHQMQLAEKNRDPPKREGNETTSLKMDPKTSPPSNAPHTTHLFFLLTTLPQLTSPHLFMIPSNPPRHLSFQTFPNLFLLTPLPPQPFFLLAPSRPTTEKDFLAHGFVLPDELSIILNKGHSFLQLPCLCEDPKSPGCATRPSSSNINLAYSCLMILFFASHKYPPHGISFRGLLRFSNVRIFERTILQQLRSQTRDQRQKC